MLACAMLQVKQIGNKPSKFWASSYSSLPVKQQCTSWNVALFSFNIKLNWTDWSKLNDIIMSSQTQHLPSWVPHEFLRWVLLVFCAFRNGSTYMWSFIWKGSSRRDQKYPLRSYVSWTFDTSYVGVSPSRTFYPRVGSEDGFAESVQSSIEGPFAQA